MKKIILLMLWSVLLFLPTSTLFAWQWIDLWRTADQQGARLLQAGKALKAAEVFKNSDWQAVAWYRAGKYGQALQQFEKQKTSDGQYNAGNAAAQLGRYQEAIEAYDRAIALNPHHADAITNREIVKKLLDKQKQSSCSKPSNSSAKNEKKNKENKSTNNQSSAQNKSENKEQNTAENQAQNKAGNKEQNKAENQAQNKSNNTEQNKAENQTQDKSDDQEQNQLAKNNTEKKQNNHQNNTNGNNNSQQSTPLPPTQNSAAPSLEEQKSLEANQAKTDALTHEQWQAKEDQKQLLRRLPDDPGGLLRQKFLRDYFRRHSAETGEGVN